MTTNLLPVTAESPNNFVVETYPEINLAGTFAGTSQQLAGTFSGASQSLAGAHCGQKPQISGDIYWSQTPLAAVPIARDPGRDLGMRLVVYAVCSGHPSLHCFRLLSFLLWFVLGPGGLRKAPGGPGKANGRPWGPPGPGPGQKT